MDFPIVPSCPACKTAAEERWLLTSKYWHCVPCKDDIEAIRARMPKPEPRRVTATEALLKLEQVPLTNQTIVDAWKQAVHNLTWGPHGPVT
jgi:hypothetical protein